MFSSSIFLSMHANKNMQSNSPQEKKPTTEKTFHSYFFCADCQETDFNPPTGVLFINTQQDTTGTHMPACEAALSSAEERFWFKAVRLG